MDVDYWQHREGGYDAAMRTCERKFSGLGFNSKKIAYVYNFANKKTGASRVNGHDMVEQMELPLFEKQVAQERYERQRARTNPNTRVERWE